MSDTSIIPQFLTHYYRKQPFRTLTELSADERAKVIPKLRFPK